MRRILPVAVFASVLLIAVAAFGQGRRGGYGGYGSDNSSNGYNNGGDSSGRGMRGGRGGYGGGPGFGGYGSDNGGDSSGRGMRGRGGSDRGPGGRGGRPMTEEEIQQRVDMMMSRVKSMDTNHNGMIDEQEVAGPQRRIAEFMLSRAGIQPNFPISIAEIQKKMADGMRAQYGGGPGGPPPSGTMAFGGPPSFGGDRGSRTYSYMAQTTPTNTTTIAAPTITPSPTILSASALTTTNSATASMSAKEFYRSLDDATREKIRDLASNIIHTYDKDSNGRLDKDEWSSTNGRWGSYDDANRSDNKGVEKDDLVIQLADLLKRGSLSTDVSGSTTVSGSATSTQPLRSKSGRFLTAAERLANKGLPTWFFQADRDGDGQITMEEFAGGAEWTPDLAAQFDQYDLNHDGIITAEEVLKAQKAAPAR